MAQRPYVSNVTLSLGPMDVTGAIYPPKITGSEIKLVSVCPACEEPHKVSQFYRCTEVDSHEFTVGELDRAKQVDDSLIRVSAEEAAAARKSQLPDNILELHVHRRDDIQGRTLEAGTTYVFRPKTTMKFYGVLIDLLKNRPDLVLMGHMNLRGKDKLMQITVELNNQLVMREMMWPEEVDIYADPVYDYKDSLLAVAEQFVEQSITEFDSDEYRRQDKERIEALVEAAASGAPAPTLTKKSKEESDDDLEAMLLASLEQLKAS